MIVERQNREPLRPGSLYVTHIRCNLYQCPGTTQTPRLQYSLLSAHTELGCTATNAVRSTGITTSMGLHGSSTRRRGSRITKPSLTTSPSFCQHGNGVPSKRLYATPVRNVAGTCQRSMSERTTLTGFPISAAQTQAVLSPPSSRTPHAKCVKTVAGLRNILRGLIRAANVGCGMSGLCGKHVTMC